MPRGALWNTKCWQFHIFDVLIFGVRVKILNDKPPPIAGYCIFTLTPNINSVPVYSSTMSKSSKRWLQEHNRDPFVNLARNRKLRSRAVFKLEELDRRYKLFHPGQTVVDLGAAPGSWSEYAGEKVRPGGRVIAIDLLEMQPLANVTFLRGDITDPEHLQNCIAELRKFRVDLVISDMAPNLSGIASVDQANSLDLAETASQLACSVLQKRAHFLVKLFQGGDSAAFRKQLLEMFEKVILCKPRASRANSREVYILAKGYNG